MKFTLQLLYGKESLHSSSLGKARFVIEHLPDTPQVPEALSILVKAYGFLGF
ncbi:MAG: hypothetical protein Ct9H300mP20_10530 [Gammaproteobacteria bacterium]|nr:MAG: hypothetical protein Ct9H300mP20_10530 [Gammaproteobacteria bacterium]